MPISSHHADATPAASTCPARIRVAGWAVAALAALTVLLVAASPAAAGIGAWRMGVVQGSMSSGDMAAFGQTGGDVLRVNLLWRNVEGEGEQCTEEAWNWDEFDRMVRQASRHRFRLLPVIVGSPEYVGGSRTGQQSPHTGIPSQIEPYKCFLREAVQRYGRDGSEITGYQRPITDWQIWNEPNLRAYAPAGGPNPRDYAKLVKISERLIHDADPRANIILAGMPEFTSAGYSNGRFLREFYRVRRIERQFDAVAIHPFAENVDGVRGAMERLRETLRAVGDRNRTVWVTEIGWSTGGRKPAFIVKSAKGQARELRRTFKMLRSERRRYNVGTVTWVRWRDIASAADDRRQAFYYAGLYNYNGTPKRSCRAFARLAGGSCLGQISGDPPGTRQRASAAAEPTAEAQAIVPSPPE